MPIDAKTKSNSIESQPKKFVVAVALVEVFFVAFVVIIVGHKNLT